MDKKIDYIAKIKAPQNCYFCKHLGTATEEEEYLNSKWFQCEKSEIPSYDKINEDVEKFENNMKWHKKCFKPITEIVIDWHKQVKVELIIDQKRKTRKDRGKKRGPRCLCKTDSICAIHDTINKKDDITQNNVIT